MGKPNQPAQDARSDRRPQRQPERVERQNLATADRLPAASPSRRGDEPTETESPDPLALRLPDPHLAFRGGTVESQVATLQRLNGVQRQAMLQQIGRVQGNAHVQRLMRAYRQSQSAPMAGLTVGVMEESPEPDAAPAPEAATRPPAPATPPPEAGQRSPTAPLVASGPTSTVTPVASPSVSPVVHALVQARLSVSEPNDPYEREANRVAEQVMRMPGPATPPDEDKDQSSALRRAPVITRATVEGESALEAAPEVEARIERMKGGGQPLPEAERAFFEDRLGVDLSDVRVHTDDTAAQTARDLSARAYTVGSDIAFNAGEYAPGTERGRQLLAHELTHVVQQGGAGELQRKPDDKAVSTTVAAEQTLEAADSQPSASDLIAPVTDAPELKELPDKVQGLAEAPPDVKHLPSVQDRARKQTPKLPAQDAAAIQDAKSKAPERSAAAIERQTSIETPPEKVDPGAMASDAEAKSKQDVTRAEQEASAARTQIENSFAESAAEPMPLLRDLVEPGPEGAVQLPVPPLPPAVEFDFTQNQQPTDYAAIMAALPQAPLPVEDDRVEKLATVPGVATPETIESTPETKKIMRTPLISGASPSGVVQRAQAPEEDYDPTAARARVRAMAAPLEAAPGQARQQLESQAASVKAQLNAAAQAWQQSIQAKIAQQIISTQASFAASRAELQTSLQAALAQVDTVLQTNIADARTKGEEAKGRLTDLFATHRTNVETAVSGHVALVAQMRSQRKTQAGESIQTKADQAMQRGEAKASSYPGDERGQKQAEAVRDVASSTAEEIQSQRPGVEQSIEEITQDIPAEFENKGKEALNGFDQNLPNLLRNVDDQVQVVTDALQQQADETRQKLQTTGQQLGIQLNALEQSTIANLRAMAPLVMTQVNGLLQAALSAVDAGVQQASGQVGQFVGQATQTLLGIETPDENAAQEYISQVLSFATGVPAEVSPIFQETQTKTVEQFTQIQTNLDARLQTLQEQTSTRLQTLSTNTQTAFTEVVTTVQTTFETAVTGLDGPFQEAETQVDTSLAQALTDLTTGFDQTLAEADAEIVNAIEAGLGKANEALVQLESKMEEAAREAAWRHDHPVLAALKDIGFFVLGLVAGIALILVAVVVVIGLFHVAIAGLVALGLSTALATLIVTMAGLALLAFGVYQAYQARIQEGKGGLEAFLWALGDIVGVSDIITGVQRIQQEGHVDFWSGFSIGQGIGKIGSIIFGGRINRAVRARLPTSITNPVRGSFWRQTEIPTTQSPYQVHIDPRTGRGPMGIDTSTFTSGEATQGGGIRNARAFWRAWNNTYSGTLSPKNQALIRAGRSPIVDEVWIQQFPEHAAYLGETLIHHHLDYGAVAIPLPETVHALQPGWSIWHP